MQQLVRSKSDGKYAVAHGLHMTLGALLVGSRYVLGGRVVQVAGYVPPASAAAVYTDPCRLPTDSGPEFLAMSHGDFWRYFEPVPTDAASLAAAFMELDAFKEAAAWKGPDAATIYLLGQLEEMTALLEPDFGEYPGNYVDRLRAALGMLKKLEEDYEERLENLSGAIESANARAQAAEETLASMIDAATEDTDTLRYEVALAFYGEGNEDLGVFARDALGMWPQGPFNLQITYDNGGTVEMGLTSYYDALNNYEALTSINHPVTDANPVKVIVSNGSATLREWSKTF